MKEKNQSAVALGKKGGEVTKAKLGREHYQRIAKISAYVRRQKKDDGLVIL